MSSIKAEFEELAGINAEIRRNTESLRKLRDKKKSIEASITSYLNEKNLPGVRYNGDVILIERKDKKISKNKKAREEELIALLRENGVHHAEELAERIKSVGKESVNMERIKINKTAV